MIGRIILKGLQSGQLSKNIYKTNFSRLHNVQRYQFLDQKIFNQDHYQILGVKPGTPKEEIKKQYYRLTKQYHPDINKGNEDKFKQINAAWDVLSDDKKRQEYDSYRGFFGQSDGQSTGQAFNPFSGFGQSQNSFNQQNPFHQAGGGQNPFGAGSPFENVDLDQLLQQLKKNGIKLEDLQKDPNFRDISQMLGLNQEEPKNIKDKIKLKVKQEAIKFMLKKMQEKLEKEIQFHKEQKERYQQQASGFKSQNTSSSNQYKQQQSQNYQSSYQQKQSQSNNEFDPYQAFKQQQQNQQYQQNQNQSQNQNKYEFDPFKGFNPNQNVYSNKPNKQQNNQQSNMDDIINKASGMFSNFFKKK